MKEKELALKMWENILHKIPEWLKKSRGRYVNVSSAFAERVLRYKARFCKKHEVIWINDCWLCTRFDENCRRCPLKRCNKGSTWYHLLESGYFTEYDKIKQCITIIDAIKSVD